MSFPRYPKYKDSGVEWLGEVPDGWEPVRLRFVSMTNPSKSELSAMPLDTLVSFLPMEAIGEDGTLRLDTEREIRELVGGYSYFRDGDVAVAKITPCFENGKGALMHGLRGGIGFGTTELIVIRPAARRIAPRFLTYVTRSRYFLGLGEGHMYGAGGQKRVPEDFVRNFSVFLPALPEQHAIAAFLDRETARIDALVAEQERLIELLREKRQAVISHAVTKGLDPNVPMKDSGVEWLGEVPAHWEVGPLKALLSLKHGFAFDGDCFSDSGEFVLMTPGNFREIGGFRMRENEKFYVGGGFPREYVLRPGQLLVAMTEQAPGLLGSALFVPNGPIYLHNQRLGLVHGVREDRLSVEFLFHLCNAGPFRHAVSISATGSKVRHTSPGRILAAVLALPPVSEQVAIASFLNGALTGIENLIAEAEDAILLLHDRRASMISAAVTGQIDVRRLASERAR